MGMERALFRSPLAGMRQQGTLPPNATHTQPTGLQGGRREQLWKHRLRQV